MSNACTLCCLGLGYVVQVSSHLTDHFLLGEITSHPVTRKMDGHQRRSGYGAEKYLLPLPGIKH